MVRRHLRRRSASLHRNKLALRRNHRLSDLHRRNPIQAVLRQQRRPARRHLGRAQRTEGHLDLRHSLDLLLHLLRLLRRVHKRRLCRRRAG